MSVTYDILDNDTDDLFIFEELKQKCDNGQYISPVVDPYTMNKNLVKTVDFRDARLYDEDAPYGFVVQRWYAKKRYTEWLYNMRKQGGMANFKRNYTMVPVEQGNKIIYVKQVIVDRVADRPCDFISQTLPTDIVKIYDVTNPTTRYLEPGLPNRKELPQSKSGRMDIEDDNFRARTYTKKMGKMISRTRQKLGMTQLQLAEKINANVNLIRDIELGGIVMFNSEGLLAKSLAKALDLKSIKYQE